MIKINLALRKSATIHAEAGGDAPTAGINLKNIDVGQVVAELKEYPNLIPLMFVGLLYFLGTTFLDGYKAEKLNEIETRIRNLQAKKAELETDLEGKRELDARKKALDDDERVLKTKYDVIVKLIDDRAMPAKILLDLSRVIPKEIWLSELRLDAAGLTLKGDSLDFNPISDFQKALRETIYFKDAQLKNSMQGRDETGLEVTKFDLSADRRER